ncbi:MAG: cytochrome c [Saprospiraceae bacterium]|nr:cytochrome c [Saprospiraceae bacterium]
MYKMILLRRNSFLLFGALALLSLPACSPASGDETGHEFIPDMVHPVSFESNLYSDYSLNSWDDKSVIDRRTLSQPRNPVNGTIARGYAGSRADNDAILQGSFNANTIATPANGSVPYHYTDTEEERARAMAEITTNPFPVTTNGLERGQQLFTIYCAICHGEKADGAGYLVREDGGLYPAQPANLVSDDFIASSEGRFYHSIMYGRNMMGGYSDKLSYQERWDVIHYIRSLQAKTKGMTYGPSADMSTDSASPVEASAGMEGAH